MINTVQKQKEHRVTPAGSNPQLTPQETGSELTILVPPGSRTGSEGVWSRVWVSLAEYLFLS